MQKRIAHHELATRHIDSDSDTGRLTKQASIIVPDQAEIRVSGPTTRIAIALNEVNRSKIGRLGLDIQNSAADDLDAVDFGPSV